jgi:hypothetical protein
VVGCFGGRPRAYEVAMAERPGQQSPESLVLAAGYVPCAGIGWLDPDGTRIVSLEQAVREVQGQWQQENAA